MFFPTSCPMCGTYASFLPAEALARLFGTVNPLPNLETTWNLAPTRDAPVVRLSKEGERHLDALKWGLIPYFTKDLKKARKPINARSETIANSGMFTEAFAKRGGVEIPRGGADADLRHHHHGREQSAGRDTGPDAGDHRA